MTTNKYALPICTVLGILWVFLSAYLCLAADASFSWLPNAEPTLAGYKLHYGTSSRNYTTTIDVGLPDTANDGRVYYTITGLEPGITYYFAATAYSADNLESDYSTEVVWTVPTDTGGGNTPPTASIAASPTTGSIPLKVTFDGSGSTDVDNDPLDYIWSFGDGSSATTATPYTSHVYSAQGSYTATLTVDDGADTSIPATLVINVNPVSLGSPATRPTKAVITADSTTGTAPMTVSFDGTGSTSSNANGSIVQYVWNFGDGTTASGSTTRHTYAASGAYIATLMVTDNSAGQGHATVNITVTALDNPTPPPSGDAIGSGGTKRISTASTLLQVYKLLLLK